MPALFFVYGTLTDDQQVASLLDSYRFVGDAVCVGLQRIDGRYPTLVPGNRVTGRLLETAEGDRLDRYEGVGTGLYHRFSLPVGDDAATTASAAESGVDEVPERDTATVYIGDPAGLGITAAEAGWPGSGGFSDRVADYLATQPVRIVKSK